MLGPEPNSRLGFARMYYFRIVWIFHIVIETHSFGLEMFGICETPAHDVIFLNERSLYFETAGNFETSEIYAHKRQPQSDLGQNIPSRRRNMLGTQP